MFSLFYEDSNLENVLICVTYRITQATYGSRIIMVASEEYVNTYSTRRAAVRSIYVPVDRQMYIDRYSL